MKNIAKYLQFYKEIKKLKKEEHVQFEKLRIALLASSTVNGIKEILACKCYSHNIMADIFVAGYNQYNIEILDPKSRFYKFKPDLVILFIDIKSIMGNKYFSYNCLTSKQRKEVYSDLTDAIVRLVGKVKERLSAKIVIHNLDTPVHSPLGILENKQELGFVELVEQANCFLREEFKKDKQVFLFDYNTFCARIGKDNLCDCKMYYIADMRIDFKHLPLLCDQYMAFIKSMLSLTKKCLVLDLDNTLWGGIVGEDGTNGIKLGPSTPEGRSFLEFQEYILSLFHRGVILAINSRNNYGDAIEVIKNHPYMILKESHFSSIMINWNDKVSNMNAIAQEINIGLDSLVFIDDCCVNRELIKQVLPQIKVIDMPKEPSLYLSTIRDVDDFNTFVFSEEDRNRGRLYAEQRQRLSFSESIADVDKYIKDLNTVVTIKEADEFTIPRISQLTQKINQFNMTTKRYLEEDIKRFSEDNNYLIFCAKVEDKFGDNGICGVVIVKRGNIKWEIDTLLLSCRVIGRYIENTIMGYILLRAREEKMEGVSGRFIPTKKNIPAKDFYKDMGFELVSKKDIPEVWSYDLNDNKKYTYNNDLCLLVDEFKEDAIG